MLHLMVIKTDRQDDLSPEELLVFQTFVSLVRVGFPLEPNVSWSELKEFLLLQSENIVSTLRPTSAKLTFTRASICNILTGIITFGWNFSL